MVKTRIEQYSLESLNWVKNRHYTTCGKTGPICKLVNRNCNKCIFADDNGLTLDTKTKQQIIDDEIIKRTIKSNLEKW